MLMSSRAALINKPNPPFSQKRHTLVCLPSKKAQTSIWVVCLSFFSFFFSPIAISSNAEYSAAALMQQMSNAVRTLNYQGNFIYQHRDQIEASSIAHRLYEGTEQERIVSLTGDGREVVRNGNRSYCYMPAQKTVLIGNSGDAEGAGYKSPTGLAAQWDVELLQKWYQLRVQHSDRVAGRSCQRINLIPKDRHRYGYQLCVDSENAMLLDAGLMDQKGSTIERMMFTDIRYPEQLDDQLFAQHLPGEDWRVVTLDVADKAALAKHRSGLSWQPSSVPPGFALHHRRSMTAQNGSAHSQTEHLVYSDGIASVSIFVEALGRSTEIVGPIRMGAMHGYGRVQAGKQIMVVGDVPATTVQWFADELERTAEPATAQ